MTSISVYYDELHRLQQLAASADAILMGAGAGLSTAAGLVYDGERFHRYFSDFIEKYRFPDMYTGGWHPFGSLEEKWAYWSRYIYYNRYERDIGSPYYDLLQWLKGRNYFVLTTNVDHCFQDVGFDKKRLFYTQGDFGLWQCPTPCHHETYENETTVRRMVAEQKDMRIPSELIPLCPRCQKPMIKNLRSDDSFVENAGFQKAKLAYLHFLSEYQQKNILILELGVGMNSPGVIKYPFWHMVWRNEKATFCTINALDVRVPDEIEDRTIAIQADLKEVLAYLKETKPSA